MEISTSTQKHPEMLPPVLAGPLLRHTSSDRLVLWLVGSSALRLRLRLYRENPTEPLLDRVLTEEEVHRVQLGVHAFVHLIDVSLNEPLPLDIRIGYDVGVIETPQASCAATMATERWIHHWAPHLCLPGTTRPNFVIKSRLDRILHGSCRRPHHPSTDGLLRVDHELQISNNDVNSRPALLLLTGDQVYADDVAGPMLRAIHALIERLGLFDEALESSTVPDSKILRGHPNTYYHRQDLLPANEANEALIKRFFGGVRKPIFTTANAQNHLISLAEVSAMYLLVWSPVVWQLIQPTAPALTPKDAERYHREQQSINEFVAGLPRAARSLAHLPCYMIFDDHDITDDWNLSAAWESTAYGHPFSKRIVGNALIAYFLFQAWGNAPSAFDDILPLIHNVLQPPRDGSLINEQNHKELIDRLLQFSCWSYTLNTHPRLVVLDIRTRRWRSEVSQTRPSGLMDWEALTDFQQAVMGQEAVIVVSPTPIFGVKLIEVIQRIFTFFGRPLVVDAENWMAHTGTAKVLLNIFSHTGTPQNFVILSGDVHYSFVYDVCLPHRRNSPRIWQITSSGIKNEFPKSLLEWLDRLNRWLYAPRSPLNWFTKRRRTRVTPRLPTGRDAGERLWNGSGIGLVVLDEHGIPTDIRQLNVATGGTRFLKSDEENQD